MIININLSRAAAALVLTTVGCSDSTAPTVQTKPLDEVYVLGTHVATGDDATFYAVIVDKLSGDVSLDRAIELEGSMVFGDDDAMFEGNIDEQSVTRWEIDVAGNVEPGETMGLSQLGFVPTIGVYFVSPEKAYMLDGSGLRFLVWNPKTMTIIDTIEFEDDKHGDSTPFADTFLRLDDQHLLVPLWWAVEEQEMYPFASALVLNTDEDRIERLVEQPGCSGTHWGAITESGNAWLASDAWSIFYNKLDENVPHSCALELDQDLDGTAKVLDLREKTGGRVAGHFGYAGDGVAYTMALEEDELSEDAMLDISAPFGEPAWHVWRFDLESDEPGEKVAGLEGAMGSYVLFDRVEERTFVRLYDPDSGKTTLYELPESGAAKPKLKITGDLVSVAKVR